MPVIELIVSNSSTYSAPFVQGSVILQQLHPHYMTDYLQFRQLLHLFYVRIDDAQAALFLQYDRLFSISIPILPILYKD